jgi:Adenylate and Guanylate cyclase catalytic domain/Double zinc ribbon
MQCAQCQFDNPPAMQFCVECGAKLAFLCPQCGAENQPTFKFCGQCGRRLVAAEPVGTVIPMATEEGGQPQERAIQSYTPAHLAAKILTSRSALEGERKQVTVLFVDVSGFTALSERLDPEDVHQLMERAFALMLDEVHRYEGTVNQFLGDGIMALFGAPITHEDHPIRAVHAALGIQRAWRAYRDQLMAERGINFQVRMGVNTGAVDYAVWPSGYRCGSATG